jgi:alcohol oxidase
MTISSGTHRNEETQKEILQAAQKLGYPIIQDLQDLDSSNGFSPWLRYVLPNGKRQDAAHAYIHPLIQDGNHPNLHVLVETKVSRILLDSSNVSQGVEVVPSSPADGTIPSSHSIKARQMVVLSAGAFGSPLILERSGIGSRAVLERVGIQVIADLPGVGNNLQDHHMATVPYRTSLQPLDTLDALIRGRLDPKEAPYLLGWNGCDVASKIRPLEEEVVALGPEFQALWERDFQEEPNRPLVLLAILNG